MTDQVAALRQLSGPEDQLLLDQLASSQSQLAKLRLARGGTISQSTPEHLLARDEGLATEIENLQAGISRRTAEFRVKTQPVTISTVQLALPGDAALVEIFSYKPFYAKATEVTDRYGAPRYLEVLSKFLAGLLNIMMKALRGHRTVHLLWPIRQPLEPQ